MTYVCMYVCMYVCITWNCVITAEISISSSRYFFLWSHQHGAVVNLSKFCNLSKTKSITLGRLASARHELHICHRGLPNSHTLSQQLTDPIRSGPVRLGFL